MPSNPRVFLSYARKDGERFATDLRERLNKEQPEITLWLDRAEMEGGVGWWKQIEEALDQVKYLVAVMTPAALQSDMTRKEWRYARQRGVNVYPIKGVPNEEIDYQSLPSWMRKAHFFDLEKEWGTFVNYLKSDRQPPRVPFMSPELPLGFVQRPAEFNQLLELLLDPNKENPVAITTTLQGSGGFGKTTLAMALCHDERIITAFDDGILWVTLGQQPNLLAELTKCYEALTGEQPAFLDLHQASVKLTEKLENCNCLIVLDDVWKKGDLEPFFQGGKGCARLITTRKFDIASSRQSHRIDVDEMKPTEATELLMQRLPDKLDDVTPFIRLAQRLGNWPLLIKLASGALASRLEWGDTVGHALTYVNLALDKRRVTAFDEKDEKQRSASVEDTLEISLGLLELEERQALAELAIFPEDAEIPLSTLACLWQLDDLDTEDRVRKFADHALLDLDLGKGLVSQHDEIRAYLGRELPDAKGIHARLIDAWGNPLNLPDRYAWRFLAYHLDKAGRTLELRRLLLDWNWIKAKLSAADINALLGDYKFLLDDPTLRLLQGALRLSAHVFALDKSQLASHLVGRLLNHPDADLSALVQAVIANQKSVWLLPLASSLMSPGGTLLCTLTGHSGWVTAVAVAVTPDGRRAVSGSSDSTLKVWDLDSGAELHTLDGHADVIEAVAVTPDGRRAVSGSRDNTLKVWDLDSGAELHTLEGHADVIEAVAVTPDGRRAVSGSRDNTLKVWDLDSGAELHTLAGHSFCVTAVAVTPDGRRAVSGSNDSTLKVWNLDSGAELHTLAGHCDGVTAVAVTPDGRRAVSGSNDRTLKVWDLDSGAKLHTLAGHFYWVTAVAVTPDGRRAVSGSRDSTLKVWNLDRGAELYTLDGHYGDIKAVTVTPDGRLAVSGSMDSTLKVWNLDSGTELRTLEGHFDGIEVMAVTPDGRRAVSGSRDSTLKVWDLDSEAELRTPEGHSDRVTAVAVTPDGRLAVSGSMDSTLKVWDLDSGAELHTLEGHSGSGVTAVAVTPDGRRAVSGSWDNILKVWDLSSGAELRTLEGHSDRVTAVAVTPDGRRAVSGSRDNTLKVWDLDSGAELHTLDGHADDIGMAFWGIKVMAVTPDGRRAVSGSWDNILKVWDLSSGAELRTLEGHSGGVMAVAVTPDGRRAVSGSDDSTLKVWDLSSGAELRTLEGHSGWVTAVAVTPDGRRVVSGSMNCTLKVWDLESGECVLTFHGEGIISTCAIAPDNKTIVVGESFGRVHILRLEGDKNPCPHP